MARTSLFTSSFTSLPLALFLLMAEKLETSVWVSIPNPPSTQWCKSVFLELCTDRHIIRFPSENEFKEPQEN
jgi:hypothetical protein